MNYHGHHFPLHTRWHLEARVRARGAGGSCCPRRRPEPVAKEQKEMALTGASGSNYSGRARTLWTVRFLPRCKGGIQVQTNRPAHPASPRSHVCHLGLLKSLSPRVTPHQGPLRSLLAKGQIRRILLSTLETSGQRRGPGSQESRMYWMERNLEIVL